MSNDLKEMVFVPGLICNRAIWNPVIDELGSSDVHVFDNFNRMDQLEDMAAHIVANAPNEFVLFGHSMGARIAYEVCNLAKGRVSGLAIFNTGVHGVKPGEHAKRYDLLELGRKDGMNALVDKWLPPMLAPNNRTNAALMKPLVDMCLEEGLEKFYCQIAALLNRKDRSNILSELDCPVLVGVGREDEWSTVEQHQEIVNLFKNPTFSIYEDCGHMAPFEEPIQVADSIKTWLNQNFGNYIPKC